MSKIPYMGKIPISRRNLWSLTIVIVAIFTIVLTYVWIDQQNSRKERIESLEQQLARQLKINHRLVDNFSKTQEVRLKAEVQLAELSERLTATEEQLSSLEEMDWESRYEAAKLENETLAAKITEMEFQHSVDIDTQSESHNLLLAAKSFIEEDFIRLEFEHEKLAEEYTQLQQQYAHDAKKWKKDNKALSEDLNSKESEIKDQMQLITKLQSDKNTYKDTIAKLENQSVPKPEEKISGSTTTQKANKNISTKDYRSVRLQSLNDAMTNRNSSDRKKILMSVIPTIPDGISGSELILLISGMESEDILSVIQAANNYITRPLDGNVLNALSKNMNESDAGNAAKILANE